MEIQAHQRHVIGIRLVLVNRKIEVAHVYLYILYNDLHEQPFGLLEDLWVRENQRKMGYGKLLVKKVIDEANKYGCYKLIATSREERPLVHKFYRGLGFSEYGKEFRFDF